MLQAIVNITGINAICQSFLLAVYFMANRKGMIRSNQIIAVLLLSFGLLIFSTLPGASWKFASYYKVAFIMRRVAFLIAPLFYLYIKSIVKPSFKFKWTDGLHFLPFLILLGMTIWQATYLNIWYLTFGEEYYFHTGAILVHILIYFILIIPIFKKNKLSVKSFFAELDSPFSKWLRFFIIGYTVFWLVNLQNLVLMKFFKLYAWCPYASSIYCLTPFILLNFIALFALLKPDAFFQKTRNGNHLLDPELENKYKNRLLQAMDQQKPYLNTDLNLADLAQRLNISIKHLSYIINHNFHINFYDFINQYRVDESKNYLKDPSEGGRTILNIAYQVGFNSKSTFNAAFKKQTGMTPSHFRKTHMETNPVAS